MPTVETNGIETYYESTGQGPPVILLHGAFSDHSVWTKQVEELSRDYTVITYDLRGHGKSQKGEPESYQPSLLAEDLHGLITTLELDRPSICGISFGGMVGLEYATTHPDNISHLVVAGTVTPEIRTKKEWVLRKLIVPIASISADTIGERRLENALAWITARLSDDNSGQSQNQNGESHREQSPSKDDQKPIAEIMHGMRSWTGSELDLSLITAPTLVVYGEYEPFAEAHLPVYDEPLDSAQKAEIPDAGHKSHLEAPSVFARVVQSFLDKSDTSIGKSDN